MELTLRQKLDFLWQDFTDSAQAFVAGEGISGEFLKNFKNITIRSIQKIDKKCRFVPDCATCKNNCCLNSDFRVFLSLGDVADLTDRGYAEDIQGNFKGLINLLDNFLEQQNHSEVSTFSQELNHKAPDHMPFLKKSGSSCIFATKEGQCKIYSHRPSACKRFPYRVSTDTKSLEWDNTCQNPVHVQHAEERETFKPAIHSVIDSENEKLRDIWLLMLNRENLANIGFTQYL